jgi:hypothetical protein
LEAAPAISVLDGLEQNSLYLLDTKRWQKRGGLSLQSHRHGFREHYSEDSCRRLNVNRVKWILEQVDEYLETERYLNHSIFLLSH